MKPKQCALAKSRRPGVRCWTCPRRDLDIDLATEKGRAFSQAQRAAANLQHGLTVQADELPADVAMALDVILEERAARQREVDAEAMKE